MATDADDVPGAQAGRIALIELHDSRVSALRLEKGGDGVLSFDHLNVYIEESPDHYGIWSYESELVLGGIERFRLDKPLGAHDYISDGKVVGADGREIELASALQWTPALQVEIIMSSSGILSLAVSRVRLVLLKALKRYEEWLGPLR